MAHRIVSGFEAAFLVAVGMFGCTPASSPPQASEPTQPTPSSTPADVAPTPSASTEAPVTAPPAASASATNPTPPSDCSSHQAGSRERATCDAKEEFNGFVATHQSCSSASQCTIVTGSCPFGCFVPVAKSAEAETLKKLTSLGDQLDKAGHRCVYRCMAPPAPSCVEGRCSAGTP